MQTSERLIAIATLHASSASIQLALTHSSQEETQQLQRNTQQPPYSCLQALIRQHNCRCRRCRHVCTHACWKSWLSSMGSHHPAIADLFASTGAGYPGGLTCLLLLHLEQVQPTLCSLLMC